MQSSQTTANRIKVIFKSETKKFKKPESYEVLLQQTLKAFGSALPKQFKFFYQDQEGDIISISCQEDLEEALESIPSLKLVIDESSESARFFMEPDYSMRSSINMPSMNMIGQSSNQNQINYGGQPIRTNSSFYFEEVKQQKNADTQLAGNEVSTDVRNLVNFHNIGCGSNVQTVEKELNARVDTNEFGSQVLKDVKEACCDGSIQMSSKGSQMMPQGKEQEVHCQIIRPEDQEEEEQINEEGEGQGVAQSLVCFRCDGSQINKKGLPCRRCNGTGKLQSIFYKGLIKVLKDEVQSYTTNTFQRMIGDYLGKKATDQAMQVHASVTCDGCNAHPIQGIRYKCSACPDFDFCEKCEAEKTHPHPMLKIRKAEHAPAFIKCSYASQSKDEPKSSNQSMRESSLRESGCKRGKDGEKKIIYSARFVRENFGDRHKVKPREQFVKSWTFRNNSDKGEAWPTDTTFIQTNGDNLEAVSQIVQAPVNLNDEVTIQIPMVAPLLAGKYCAFFRFVHGDNQRFGQKVWCDILVEDAPVEVMEIIQKQEEPVVEIEAMQQMEEVSSLLEENEQRESSLLSNEILHEREPIIDLIPLRDQLKVSQIDEPMVIEQIKKQEVAKEEVKQEVIAEVEAKDQEQEKAMDDAVMKKAYMEELESAGIKDNNLFTNLKYMMNMGYLNYKINYNLLTRNNNDLIIAVNKLCNNIVSDSMFEIRK